MDDDLCLRILSEKLARYGHPLPACFCSRCKPVERRQRDRRHPESLPSTDRRKSKGDGNAGNS